jgi:hypothetical protein
MNRITLHSDGFTADITRVSPFSGKAHVVTVPMTASQYERYARGELIQDAFPHLPPSIREFIKTGITPTEWNEAFNNTHQGDHQ